MPRVALSVDEIVSTIKRSALPAILCEGNTEIVVLRCLELEIDPTRVGLIPCGGRSSLFAIFARRHEFAGKAVAFLADKDMWVFSSVPVEYSEIRFTEGYSIENDIYASADLEALLSASERVDFGLALDCVCDWFAFCVRSHLSARAVRIDFSVYEILDASGNALSAAFVRKTSYIPADPQIAENIKANYRYLLRGHTLFQLLVRFLSHTKRTSKFSYSNLIEIAIRMNPNEAFLRLVSDTKAILRI